MNTTAVKSWTCSGSTVLDEASFLKNGRALYIYHTKNDGVNRYMEAKAPRTQDRVHAALMTAFEQGEVLAYILMSTEDFKAYNDACVAKEPVVLAGEFNALTNGVTV